MGRAEKIDSGANGEVIFYRSHYQISTKNGIDSKEGFVEPKYQFRKTKVSNEHRTREGLSFFREFYPGTYG